MDIEWITFTDIGNYSNSCTFVRCSNDDANTDPNTIQTILHVPFDSTVYLDFSGGSEHLQRVSRWIGGWTEADTTSSTKWYNQKMGEVKGPGIVMRSNFKAGNINLMGNNWDGRATYYAFVCPQGKRGYC